jgi:hypothetical protein
VDRIRGEYSRSSPATRHVVIAAIVSIAANVRALQQRIPPVSPALTPDLVNDGLPGRDEPVRMALVRDRSKAASGSSA